MSKNKKTNPTIRQIVICVVAFLLVTSILGGGCASIAGKLGIKDLFPNIGFIPLFPEDRESIDLDADETSSELESDTESIKESESEPEKESQEAPDVSESISSSGGNVVDSESEGKLPGESESENPSGSESESESSGGAELPGGSESEGESSGGTELPGESESESEKPGESESESESEKPGESESESEKPGESESESESNSNNDDESTSESFPTDVVTYPFSGLDILNTGGTFTKEVVTINATSSSDTKLRTREIIITVKDDYSIVKVVLNCESNNTYEFTVEITPDGGIINFEGGIVEIVINGGTAELKITFNRTVTVDSIDVSVST